MSPATVVSCRCHGQHLHVRIDWALSGPQVRVPYKGKSAHRRSDRYSNLWERRPGVHESGVTFTAPYARAARIRDLPQSNWVMREVDCSHFCAERSSSSCDRIEQGCARLSWVGPTDSGSQKPIYQGGS